MDPGHCGDREQYKKDLEKVVLSMGYDSSGYGWFHRLLQQQIIQNNNVRQ